MSRVHIVTLARLNRAESRVVSELKRHGLWDERLEAVDVCLVTFAAEYGYQRYGSTGEICVPMFSVARICDIVRGGYVSLADLLRHEYGHALADTHRGLFRSRRFRDAFGTHHDDPDEFEYDPEFHVSEYAAAGASEDFAEVFMVYLRHGGDLPAWHDTPVIRRKWSFVRRLGAATKQGRTRWLS